MGKIIFITGGARSGKSTYAASLAEKHKKVAFIATCQALDREMAKRIKLHQHDRPLRWKTFEEPKKVAGLINDLDNRFDCILIDCLTLLVSNLLLAKRKEEQILEEIRNMLKNLKKKKARAIIVSNEVGLGLVPANKLGRDFRDIAGKVNQLAAKRADEVFLTISGIPLKIKTRSCNLL
ncbi:MAG: bifunctional adenosylcobinamide kinase/adenosylcobinamide-phosphate guanylyltransferase [Candidatus Omnitrophica bacterium]|nr:bifunctional adenosylcobinamide kinase/adenosylcobinamide-phosphate guanylyltransferase [Candidatus Omnitrophota bacterium]